MALKQVRGGTVAVGDLFSAGDSVGPLIATALLTALVTGIGAMFCYLPGIIAAGLLMLAFLIVLDQRVGAVEAMKRSWNTLKADLWMATAYYFVIALLASLGAYVCGVGMLFSFPLLFLGTALVYRDFFDDGTEAGNTAGLGQASRCPRRHHRPRPVRSTCNAASGGEPAGFRLRYNPGMPTPSPVARKVVTHNVVHLRANRPTIPNSSHKP
jgi:hypothetical protein